MRVATGRKEFGLLRCLTLARWAAAVLVCAVLAPPARGDFREAFESNQPSWRLADSDCSARLAVQRRDFQSPHTGNACEFVQMIGGQGTYAYLVHDVPHARLIAEWLPSLWVKSDRAGLQLLARVVLPRTVEPSTGQPMTALLRGDAYDRVGLWQQLTVRNVDQLLDRQVRVLRSHFGPEVDPREAYVDLLVLNAYGGGGVTNAWIDDLEIFGHVPAMSFASHRDGNADPGYRPGGDRASGGQAASPAPVQLRGSVTVADGRPFFPRVIEHNGENLELLKSIGFNVVKLAAAPTDLQLREAARLGLWLLAPPPNDGYITAAHDRVLAWYLGSGLTGDRLEVTRQWVADLRRGDPRSNRLMAGEPAERTASYTRLLDVAVLRKPVLGSSLGLREFGLWVEDRPAVAKPGTPLWIAIQTEPHSELFDQWTAFGLGLPASLAVEPDQIRLQAMQAVASGARGLVFASRSPLDQPVADAQMRASVLRRLNMELDVIEPWLAGGTRSREVVAAPADVRVGLLQTERSQLLMILDQSPQQQFTVGEVPSAPLSLVVPCASTAPLAYRLTPGGLSLLTHRRVAGGIRLNIDTRGQVALIVLSQDPLVINHVARTLAQHGAACARVQYDVAGRELELVEAVHSRLAGQAPTAVPADQWLAAARDSLRQCEVLLGGNDPAGAHLFAERTLSLLAQVRHSHWLPAVRDFPTPAASPFCVSFSSLVLHNEATRRLQATPEWSLNVLPASDFESLDHLRNTGWQNVSGAGPETRTLVELSPQGPHGGQTCLRLQAEPVSAQQASQAFDRPPIQIATPPIRVRRGQLLRFHGWVRVSREVTSSQDGLMVYDSLGGEALADRVRTTDGWREIVLYRAAGGDSDVSLVFALTGFGEAYLDDVTISLHEPIADGPAGGDLDQARRLPPVGELQR